MKRILAIIVLVILCVGYLVKQLGTEIQSTTVETAKPQSSEPKVFIQLGHADNVSSVAFSPIPVNEIFQAILITCMSSSKFLISPLWEAFFRLNFEPLTLTTLGFTRGRLGLSISDSAIRYNK